MLYVLINKYLSVDSSIFRENEKKINVFFPIYIIYFIKFYNILLIEKK